MDEQEIISTELYEEIYSLISHSEERLHFESKLQLTDIPYRTETFTRFSRLGYSTEYTKFLVLTKDKERVVLLFNKINLRKPPSVTGVKWGTVALIIFFVLSLIANGVCNK